ncbi:MAG: murein biosynthesis integral membrane protein MurJ [Alphaproteobacteria bacterium]|nr:murein biosynthesis integral membrane protein MurJ [Alphaproteobacteria bacterium]|tara:strand:+ start:15907 stop:17442 length:1536 start_codon:yes stop_codon:yes gene_type:complete
MKLFRAMATVGGLTGLSRIAGFVRDILTASILGAGPVADAFFVALKLPNFFRRVTAEGAFSVSFVPVYTEIDAQKGRAQANDFASNMFMLMLGALSAFCLLAICVMPVIIYGVAPGFHDDPVRFDLATELARITFPYLLAMSLVALLGGVLNAQGRFAPFAFAPVLFNLSLISALLLADHFTSAGHALAWGVAGAGALQLGWLMIAAARSSFKWRLRMPHITPETKKVLSLMGPGVIGAGVMHINLFADLIIASFLQTGAISYLYYADRLNQLPLGIIGIAVGTALLPILSKAISAKKDDEVKDLFNRALEYCFALALPAAAALAMFAPLIISTLFERGAFDAQDSMASAQVLLCYVTGLPAYIAIKVFSTAHWAQQNTKTPVKIAVVATIFNIALSLALINVIGVAGIALATGLSGWLQVVMHCHVLKSQARFALDARFVRSLAGIVAASGVMLAGAYGVNEVIFAGAGQITSLCAVVISGGIIYALSLFAFGVINPSDIKQILKRKAQA